MGSKPFTQDEIEAIIKLRETHSVKAIAEKLNRHRRGIDGVVKRLVRHGFLENKPNKDDQVRPIVNCSNINLVALPKKYTEHMKVVADKFMVFCDPHIPFIDWDLFKKMLDVAKAQGIKVCCVGGDVFDLPQFSTFPDANKYTHEDLNNSRRVGIKFFGMLLQTFDKVYVISGNHDFRIFKSTHGKIADDSMFEYLSGCEREGRVMFSCYRYMTINHKWLLVHPQSKGSDPLAEGKGECAKYHMNTLVTHHHKMGWAYDVSGKYVAVGCGALIDPEMVDYYMMNTSKSPTWNTGFVAVNGDNFYLFPKDRTDWKMWTSKKIL